MRRTDRASVLAYIEAHPGAINADIVAAIYGDRLGRYEAYQARLWINQRISELSVLGHIEPVGEVVRGKPNSWRRVQ